MCQTDFFFHNIVDKIIHHLNEIAKLKLELLSIFKKKDHS